MWIADSISSISLLVSLEGGANDECIQCHAKKQTCLNKKNAMDRADNLHPGHPSEESTNESIKVKSKNDLSAHNMKYIVILELKNSTRFKFKQLGGEYCASSFANELA